MRHNSSRTQSRPFSRKSGKFTARRIASDNARTQSTKVVPFKLASPFNQGEFVKFGSLQQPTRVGSEAYPRQPPPHASTFPLRALESSFHVSHCKGIIASDICIIERYVRKPRVAAILHFRCPQGYAFSGSGRVSSWKCVAVPSRANFPVEEKLEEHQTRSIRRGKVH